MSRKRAGTSMPSLAENTVSSSMRIVPRSGSASPAMQRKSVVLPQPLGPSNAKKLPGRNLDAHPAQSGVLGFAVPIDMVDVDDRDHTALPSAVAFVVRVRFKR